MKALYASLIALLLVSCTTVSPVRDTANIKSVAVVAAIHDEFLMRYRGFSSVDTERVPVAWGMEARLEQQLTRALGQHYEVRKLDENLLPQLFAATAEARDSNFKSVVPPIVDTVKKQVRPGQVDAIIVALDKPGALYHYSPYPGGDYPFYVGFMYRICVFDGRTLELIGNEYGSVPRTASTLLYDYDNPAIDVDIGWRGGSFSSLPDATKQRLQQMVYALIDRSAPFTLQNRLHLIP